MVNQYGEGGTFSVQMDGPFGNAGSSVKITQIQAPLADWKGAVSPFSQVVAVDGVTNNSKVDLQIGYDQLDVLRDQEIAFTAANEDGVVTLYAIGEKPKTDIVLQATLTEVVA